METLSSNQAEEVYTANESLQLLWVWYKEPKVDLKLSIGELKVLQLNIIDEWETLTTHYKKKLVSQDKLEILSAFSKNEPMFL